MDIQKEYSLLMEAFSAVYENQEQLNEEKRPFPFKKVAAQQEKARKGSVYGKPATNEPAPNVSDKEKSETRRFSKMHQASEKAKREKQVADKARRSSTFYKDTHPASAPKMKKAHEEVETDLFDIILEHLVAEGYAETNEAALAIMANMSEEWKQSIVEAPGEWFGGLRDRARASRAAQMQSSQPTPKPLPSSSSPFAKPASRNDSGKLTTYGAGGGAAAERAGQTRTQVMQQGAKNLENKKSKPVNQGPNFGR